MEFYGKRADSLRRGDVDDDGEVTFKDRLILTRYLAGWKSYGSKVKSRTAADINSDGKITAMDRVLLSRFLGQWEGYETYFVQPEPKSAEEFGFELADLINEYKNKVDTSGLTEEQLQNEVTSGRVIVSAENGLSDLGDFVPAAVVQDDAGIYILQFTDAAEAVACTKYLSEQYDVEFAEIDMPVTGYAVTEEVTSEPMAADSTTHLSWGVEATGADQYAARLVEKGITDSVIVAVVDSGVDASHSFLAGRVLAGTDFVDGDDDPTDGHGHGTHVSGTVVDCTPGLNVKILPVRVLDNWGSGYSSQVAAGILYAVENGAKVINLSLGGGHNEIKDHAVKAAINSNVVVVQAAGNNNQDTSLFCPAHITEGITVAAVDGNLNKASFSNFGNAVDISAPGVDILSCLPGGQYASWSGTSMATPHVSAAAAMLLLDNSALTPAKIEGILKDNATDLGDQGWDMYYGAGLLTLSEIEYDEHVIGYGQCGEDLYWHYYDDGTLKIFGGGRMWDRNEFPEDTLDSWKKCVRAMTRLNMTEGITYIGSEAFDMSFYDAYYADQEIADIMIIPDTVVEIGVDAFIGTAFTGKLVLSKNLKIIGDCAFVKTWCGGPREMTLPEGLQSIGYCAFYPCTNLSGTLNIPSTVETIGDYAFEGCTGLTGLTFSEGVKSIGDHAFYGCRGITGSLTIPDSMTEIGINPFTLMSGLTEIKTKNNPNYYSYDGMLVRNDGTVITCPAGKNGTVTIPEGVKSIGAYAFYGCNKLNGKLTIPNSVKSIGSYAFYGCSGIVNAYFYGNAPSVIPSVDSHIFGDRDSSFLVYHLPNKEGWPAEGELWNGYKTAIFKE